MAAAANTNDVESNGGGVAHVIMEVDASQMRKTSN